MLDYNLDTISIQKCFVFNAVVRKGSVATAARHLFIPSFKIQNDLKSLEKSLGFPLLLRNQRKFVLTEEGKRFADFCRSVVEGFEYLEAKKKTVKESLVIATYYGFSRLFLPPIIDEFSRLYPHVHFKILSGVEYLDFIENDVDVVIGSSINGRSDIEQTEIASFPHLLYASSKYIENFGIPKNYTEFRHHRFLIFKGEEYRPKEIFDLIDPFVEATNFDLLCELAKKGIGIAPLPQYYVTELNLTDGMLIPLLDNLECSEGRLFFMTRRFSKKAYLTQSLLEIIHANMVR